ncbi:MAG: 4-phosphoerythronate dehydrogenase [Pseudomonadales bacterium]|nr:4-phosphoerythronate dehydrogenase [Pseudomonadales bacterium]NRA14613.1 4-phosphoerythronate dehydrogenase [Oceanospirillaceae bacterium]
MKPFDLNIVADENIPAVEQMFAQFGSITRVDGRTLTPEQLVDVDVLLVRSVTKVNQQLLANSPVKFVGTATIGTDHVDKSYLQSQHIQFASAPGCNADAVVEYDLSCIMQLLQQSNECLADKVVAIIGVGNVGSRLASRLTAVGVKQLLLNDPPRAEHEAGFSDLTLALQTADIIALHTPLIKGGPWPTQHLLGSAELAMLKPGAILLNAGRGPAIKGNDLLEFLRVRSDVRTVLDVWEHEPEVDRELAAMVNIATAHIAGYSLEGKLRGTFMLKQALADYLQVDCKESLQQFLPEASITSVQLTDQANATGVINLLYDPYRDDRALRATLHGPDQRREFDLLRKNYPVRREFSSLAIGGSISDSKKLQILQFGFSNWQ